MLDVRSSVEDYQINSKIEEIIQNAAKEIYPDKMKEISAILIRVSTSEDADLECSIKRFAIKIRANSKDVGTKIIEKLNSPLIKEVKISHNDCFLKIITTKSIEKTIDVKLIEENYKINDDIEIKVNTSTVGKFKT